MEHRNRLSIARPLLAASLVLISLCFAKGMQSKKLTADGVIARHLESIGSLEARSTVKTRAVSGMVVFTSRIRTTGSVEGPALMISEGEMLRYIMRFPTMSDITDEFSYDGSKTRTSVRPTGGRSHLNDFLEVRNVPLREGLMGGVLSTAWPALTPLEGRAKLEYQGVKKIRGLQMHKITYKPRKEGQGVKIALYFDAETFKHLQSEYEFEIGATVGGSLGDSWSGTESSYKLTEEFDDFKEVNGLNLPHKYRLQVAVRKTAGNALNDWDLVVDRIEHNRVLQEDTFKIR